MAIDSFRGKNFFLSNFYPCTVVFEGIKYSSSEAAFQAQKALDHGEKLKIAAMSPAESKRYIHSIPNRQDWQNISLETMYCVLKAKFDQNPELKQKLLDTGDEILVEGNTWNDTFYGVCNGKGENHLGKILMKLREEYKKAAGT